MLDGTYLQGWCLLIAFSGQHVLGWQWCDRESKPAWTALLERLPAPEMVVVDGNGVCLGLDVDGDRGWADDRRNQIAGVAPAGPEFGFTDDSWASVRSAALGACLLEAARVRIASA